MGRFKTVESNIIQKLFADYTEIYVERVCYEAGARFSIPLKESDEPKLEKIGEFGAKIIRRLALVEGITEIQIFQSNAVRITKDKSRKWEDEISGELKRAICEFEVCEDRG